MLVSIDKNQVIKAAQQAIELIRRERDAIRDSRVKEAMSYKKWVFWPFCSKKIERTSLEAKEYIISDEYREKNSIWTDKHLDFESYKESNYKKSLLMIAAAKATSENSIMLDTQEFDMILPYLSKIQSIGDIIESTSKNSVITDKTIIINGRIYKMATDFLSYSEIANLAFPDRKESKFYTLTFKSKESLGSLTHGESLKLIDGMTIDIGDTSNA